MKTMALGTAAAVMVGGLYAGGAFGGGEVYDRPVADVYATLAYMPMPKQFKETFSQVPGSEIRVDRVEGQSVTWRFTQNGHELGRFRADLAPSGAGTRVTVGFQPGDAIPEGDLREVAALPLIESVAEIAIAEQVDATLESRPFDEERMARAIAVYVATHQDEVKQYATKMVAAAKNIEEGGEAALPGGMGDSRFGTERPVPHGEPMLDLSQKR